MDETMKEAVWDILEKRCGVDFRQRPEDREEPLLGPRLQVPARELLYVYADLERLLGKPVGEEDVKEGRFDTAEHILACVERALAQN